MKIFAARDQRDSMRVRVLATAICFAFWLCPAVAQPVDSVLRAAEEQRPAYLKTLEQLVNLDSGTDDGLGLAKVQDVLAQRLRDLGAAVEIGDASPSAGKVVVGRFEGKGERSILLMDHYDTVFLPARRGSARSRSRATGHSAPVPLTPRVGRSFASIQSQ
jgi:hypothetical protein